MINPCRLGLSANGTEIDLKYNHLAEKHCVCCSIITVKFIMGNYTYATTAD